MHAVVTRGVRLAAPLASVVVPDLEVASPGITVLGRPHGTGASTFVELCAGTLAACSGAVRVLGLDPADPRLVRSRSICRTTIGLAERASVRQHVRLFAHAAGVDEEPFLARFAAHGPLPWLDAPTERLSAGMARLAWVVLTTTPQRELIVLDEPFLGLDDAASAILLAEIEAWAGTSAVLLVDHDAARGWSRDVARIAMGSGE